MSDEYMEIIVDHLVNGTNEILRGRRDSKSFKSKDFDPDANLESLGNPPYGESNFDYAILLASTCVSGKKNPEKLASMLRDPEIRLELKDKEWNLLADFIEGKLKSKPGRRKIDAPFGFVGRKHAAEHQAALTIRFKMQMRRATGKKVWGVLPELIDTTSAKYGANPVKVAEILKKGR